eukprot:3960477-Ditylum_brightwellii.AAC.1
MSMIRVIPASRQETLSIKTGLQVSWDIFLEKKSCLLTCQSPGAWVLLLVPKLMLIMRHTVSWRSRTGFFVYLNCLLIYWLSKKQTSVESSSFGSEFVAMKQYCEYLRGL